MAMPWDTLAAQTIPPPDPAQFTAPPQSIWQYCRPAPAGESGGHLLGRRLISTPRHTSDVREPRLPPIDKPDRRGEFSAAAATLVRTSGKKTPSIAVPVENIFT